MESSPDILGNFNIESKAQEPVSHMESLTVMHSCCDIRPRAPEPVKNKKKLTIENQASTTEHTTHFEEKKLHMDG